MLNHAIRGKNRYPGKIDNKAIGAWWLSGGVSPENAVAVYSPKGANSVSDSYKNIVNPGTYDASPSGSAPLWNKLTGWYTARNASLDTGITATQEWSIVIRLVDECTGESYVCGSAYNGVLTLSPRYNSSSSKLYSAGNFTSYSSSLRGEYVMGLSGKKGFLNGSHVATCPSGTGSSLINLLVARSHGTSYGFTGYVYGVSIYNTAITDDQMESVSSSILDI